MNIIKEITIINQNIYKNSYCSRGNYEKKLQMML